MLKMDPTSLTLIQLSRFSKVDTGNTGSFLNDNERGKCRVICPPGNTREANGPEKLREIICIVALSRFPVII